MTKAPKFKKSDFKVGQKVYSESVNNIFSKNATNGVITEEEVVSVGNKYVTTNVNKYSLETGEEVSNYEVHHVLHLEKNEAERKVTKDKLYKRLSKEFEKKFGEFGNQPLYKALTLEDLKEIARIIDKRLWLGDNSGDNQKHLKNNLVKLWEEKNKFLAQKIEIKISNDAKICFFAVGFEKYGFEVFKGEKVLCKFNMDAKKGYDFGFTYFIQMNDEEVEQGILNADLETAFDFKTVVAEILEKEGWAEKVELYTSIILEALEEQKNNYNTNKKG